jgi:hypothetical protein
LTLLHKRDKSFVVQSTKRLRCGLGGVLGHEFAEMVADGYVVDIRELLRERCTQGAFAHPGST